MRVFPPECKINLKYNLEKYLEIAWRKEEIRLTILRLLVFDLTPSI